MYRKHNSHLLLDKNKITVYRKHLHGQFLNTVLIVEDGAHQHDLKKEKRIMSEVQILSKLPPRIPSQEKL